MPSVQPNRDHGANARSDVDRRRPAGARSAAAHSIAEVRYRSGVLLVKPTGPVIGQRESRIMATQIEDGFHQAGKGLHGLVFDLSDVHMMCSMGLGVCLDARNRAASMKAKCLVYGISEQLGELFRTLKLTKLFMLVNSPDELRRALSR